MKLIIETTRELTQREYEKYKLITPLQVNWDKLEAEGSAEVTFHLPDEKVITKFTLIK